MQIKTTYFLNIISWICLFGSYFSLAQKFEVKVEKNNLKIGETTQIDYVFNGDGENFNAPNFKSFNQLGSFQSSNVKVINGVMSAEMVFSYVIQATKSGTFTISPAMIEYKGRFVQSRPVTIQVSNQKVQGKNNYNAYGDEEVTTLPKLSNKSNLNSNELVFIDATLNKSSVYINEPLEVNYVLYVHPRLKFQAEEIKNPDFKGFWAQTEEINSNWQEVQVGNKIYYAKNFIKAKLIPQKSGTINIEPISVEMILQIPTGRVDFWGDEEYNNVKKKILSKVKAIKVNELPIAGKPDNFTGAVGSFKFDVKVDKKELKTGEALQMDLIVSGEGNLNLFDIPKPVFPDVFELFEPKREDLITENIKGISGKIIDSYTIVPHEKGAFEIPSQKFSYFDINSKTYKTIQSSPLELNILKGTQALTAFQNKNQVTSVVNPFTLIPIANFSKIGETNFFNQAKSIWIVFTPFLLLPFLFFVERKKDKLQPQAENNKKGFSIFPANTTKDYLQNAKNSTDNTNLFYQNLVNDFNVFFKEKFEFSLEGMSEFEIRNKLSEKNISDDNIQSFMQIHRNSNLARYSPIEQNNVIEDLQLAEKIINELNEKL